MQRTVQSRDATALQHDAFIEQFVAVSRPVLISADPGIQAAVRKWSPVYLGRLYAEKPVYVCSNPVGVFDHNQDAVTGKVEKSLMLFTDAVDSIMSSEGYRYYIAQTKISDAFSELLPDIRMPLCLGENAVPRSLNLWFGGKGCKTPLHYDKSHNFLAQIYGRKRLILFEPNESAALYPAIGGKYPHVSRINVFAPDVARFPGFQAVSARRVECLISPGDILFIPKYWWHAVESLDVSISLNVWWETRGDSSAPQSG
jgi:hypothetical protein